MPLQYIEHSLAGYNATKGHTGSQTYEFDWTPPATTLGDVKFTSPATRPTATSR
jgi:hypothetical protein